MATQSDKAEVWLARHGVVRTPPAGESASERPAPLSLEEGPEAADDWSTDAQAWYQQRAQGVDVAQLLPYHQTAGK